MATEDPPRVSPEIMNLSESFGLDAFPSEVQETHSRSPADPVFERAVDHPVSEPTARAAQSAERVGEGEPPARESDRVTLLDLLDRQGGMDWREAIAIVHHLCVQLKDSSPERPMLLEPRNIEITPGGEIRVMPGRTGGDPLVLQIGRLLRALLLDKAAPPEVRLLLSRATFELPIFESLEDVARALRQISGIQQSEDFRSAYARAVVPAEARLPTDAAGKSVTVPRILPIPQPTNRLLRTRLWRRSDATRQEALLVAAALVGVAALAGLIVSRSTLQPRPAAVVPLSAAVVAAAAPSATLEAPDAVPLRVEPPVDLPPVDLRPVVGPETTHVAARTNPPAAAPSRARTVIASDRPLAVPPSVAAPVAALDSARESERRAAALMMKGQSQEASIAFDSLVMNNPLYEPNRSELTPEAYAAFQASRRVLLPTITTRDFDRAKSLLEAGDFDRALAAGKHVAAVLDLIESESDVPANLRGQVRQLVDAATEAMLAADDVIYTRADPGVVPPRPLSRQFPVTNPVGIPSNRVGVLEMVIGRQGEVEIVKLHTPLNRYHERMIVSAAKAC